MAEKTTTETKEIVILDFYEIILKKLEAETDPQMRNRIAYQLNEQFNISKINASFMAVAMDKKMAVESAVFDMKFRYVPELEKEMIEYLNARPRNDVIAGLIIDNILVQQNAGDKNPEKYYTLEGLKLLNQYFNDIANSGIQAAKDIQVKMLDQEKYLKKFRMEIPTDKE